MLEVIIKKRFWKDGKNNQVFLSYPKLRGMCSRVIKAKHKKRVNHVGMYSFANVAFFRSSSTIHAFFNRETPFI